MPWLNKGLSPDKRADALVQAMNFDEKVDMLIGQGAKDSNYTGHTPKNARLKIPAINMNDGP